MSEFNSYAVLGAGLVGNAFITALLTTKPNASIVILSRSATKSSTLPAEIANNPHIKTVVVDYSSVSSVSTALKEHAIEVVVDTVHIYDEAFHNLLAEHALTHLYPPARYLDYHIRGRDMAQRRITNARDQAAGRAAFINFRATLFTS